MLVPLFVLSVLSRTDIGKVWRAPFVLLAAGGTAVASIMVLCGFSGSLRVNPDQALHDLRAMRSALPRPVLATDRVVNLPWILGDGARSFVFGFTYTRMLDLKPERFTHGTLATALKAGQFGSVLVCESNASYQPTRQEMAHYREKMQLGDATLWVLEGL